MLSFAKKMAQWSYKYSLLMEEDNETSWNPFSTISWPIISRLWKWRKEIFNQNVFQKVVTYLRYFPTACNEELLIFHFRYYQKRRVTIKTLLVVLVPGQRISASLGHFSNDFTVKLRGQLLQAGALVHFPTHFHSLSLPRLPTPNSQKGHLLFRIYLDLQRSFLYAG